MNKTSLAARILPAFLIWVAAPMPLWLMIALSFFMR